VVPRLIGSLNARRGDLGRHRLDAFARAREKETGAVGPERCDAIRKPERFADILLACECDARGRLGWAESAYPQRQRLASVLAAAQSVVTRDIAAQAAAKGVNGPQVGALIHQARVAAVAQWLGAPATR
jgi:hypothetical protein